MNAHKIWAIESLLYNSSPEFVFEWLRKNDNSKNTIDTSSFEEKLFGRNDKLINLALGLYGNNNDLAFKIFKTGDLELQKACLSGKHVSLWVDNVLGRIIGEWKEHLINALFENEYLSDDFYENLLQKEGCFAGLDDEKWLSLLERISTHERLATPFYIYDKKYPDRYHSSWDISYDALFGLAWDLFKNTPITEYSARVLIKLAINLQPYSLADEYADEVFSRWKPNSDDPNHELFEHVRKSFVKTLPTYEKKFERLRESDDKALRLGFYRYIDSDYSIKYELNIEACYDKDGIDFLEQALRNPNFYKSKGIRDKLNEMIYSIKLKDDEDYECSSKDLLRSLYNYQIETIFKKNMRYFRGDSDYDEYFETYVKQLDYSGDRIESRIIKLEDQLKELHRFVIGDLIKKDGFDDNIDTIETLPEKLKRMRETIDELYRGLKLTHLGVYLLVGGGLGYIISSYIKSFF